MVACQTVENYEIAGFEIETNYGVGTGRKRCRAHTRTSKIYFLNTSGGEIKGTPEELLEQSSTMANEVEIKFKQGSFKVLNSYYEFAKRYELPNGNLYQGFIAASADKIFESTDVKSQ